MVGGRRDVGAILREGPATNAFLKIFNTQHKKRQDIHGARGGEVKGADNARLPTMRLCVRRIYDRKDKNSALPLL